jgi:hypothetical protein
VNSRHLRTNLHRFFFIFLFFSGCRAHHSATRWKKIEGQDRVRQQTSGRHPSLMSHPSCL